jgi:GDP-mannose 6-dehydrogenase
MKISIFGLGYVGLVSGACLARLGHEVIGVDVTQQKIDMVNDGVSPIVEDGIAELVRDMVDAGRLRGTTDASEAVDRTEVCMVSVGTPSARNGSLSTAALEAVTASIGDNLRNRQGTRTIVYRSTMLPGTVEDRLIPLLSEHAGSEPGDKFDVCVNPEFLREGSSIKDFDDPPFTIVGSGTPRGFQAMERVYHGVDAPFVQTGYRIAESVKYLCNVFHALKIGFANEIGAILGNLGVDSREASRIFCMDTSLNISKAYLRPGFAFGGSCLPKDLRAFLSLAKQNDIDIPMLGSLLNSNQKHIERAYDMIAEQGRRKVALFGLSFKGGTDDMRESPFVTLAEKLIGKGYDLKIFDPNVETARLMGANKAFIEHEIPHFDRMLQRDVAATLKGAEVIVIGHVGAEHVETILNHDPSLPIIDLQGIERIEKAGRANYHGICW